MKKLGVLIVIICVSNNLFAQQKNAAQPTEIKYAPKVTSTDRTTLLQPWHIQMKSVRNDHKLYPAGSRVEEIKARNGKFRSVNLATPKTAAIKKTRSNNIVLGKSFIGNKLYAHTPSDNTIAISRNGIIVSCDNDQILYIDTNGVISNDYFLWNDFLDSNTALLFDKYDPRVLYDNANDRFIMTVLHAPANTAANSIIMGYSKTNNPVDGWHIYNLPGNPFNDSTWIDFPSIGINKKDVFITLNMFGDASKGYGYSQSVIYQISTEKGYAGDTVLPYKIWKNLEAPDGYPGFTSVPAQDGLGDLPEQGMHFVQTRIDTGNQVYYYYIDKLLNDTTAKITSKEFNIPDYTVCANALMKDPTNNKIDSISTGLAWVQAAYIQDSQIHFVFCGNIDSGWCGIQHGQLNLKTNVITLNKFGFTGTSLCYPALASIGHNKLDHATTIVYTQADINTLPKIGAVAMDNSGMFKPALNIKSGDTIVDILGPSYKLPERWGDYSGMQRHYGAKAPETWLAATYSGNSSKRQASFNTWIAQLRSDSVASTVGLNNEQNNTSEALLFPSPTSDLFHLSFSTLKTGNVTLLLFDANGKLVKQLFNAKLAFGNHEFSFNKGVLSTGTYYLNLKQDGQLLTTKKLLIQ
jgi:Secretion system C-terminal sorting domain